MKTILVILLAAPLCAQYTSPTCGPTGGSTPWACGAWPTAAAPELGLAGAVTLDPDTGNRVLRATAPGSFGEPLTAAFKTFDSGWKRAWNADSTRFIVSSWGGTGRRYWQAFDPATMRLGNSGVLPVGTHDFEFDQTDPDLLVGLSGGVAKSYHLVTKVWSTVFDPKSIGWPGTPWKAVYGGSVVCIAGGGQDLGWRTICYDRVRHRTWQIDYRAQTINGRPFPVLLRGATVRLPATVTHHEVMLSPDGRWLAIDTHGNSPCNEASLGDYAGTTLFLSLEARTGYEWNVACGGTHWAYGYDGLLAQSTTPRFCASGIDGAPGDSRAVALRPSDSMLDSEFSQIQPHAFFSDPGWKTAVHLSWANNSGDNQQPVIAAAVGGTGVMGNELVALETTAQEHMGRVWRIAQHWATTACGFFVYVSPQVSPDGRYALFPSDWAGATGAGVCGGRRPDVFVFELR
jgi:hypothetical protein